MSYKVTQKVVKKWSKSGQKVAFMAKIPLFWSFFWSIFDPCMCFQSEGKVDVFIKKVVKKGLKRGQKG